MTTSTHQEPHPTLIQPSVDCTNNRNQDQDRPNRSGVGSAFELHRGDWGCCRWWFVFFRPALCMWACTITWCHVASVRSTHHHLSLSTNAHHHSVSSCSVSFISDEPGLVIILFFHLPSFYSVHSIVCTSWHPVAFILRARHLFQTHSMYCSITATHKGTE